MAYKDFEINPSGSNLNAGDTATNDYSSTSGDWDGTSVYTPNDSTVPASFVNVGDWVSVYLSGDTAARFVAQVTAVGAGANGTVTVSTTVKLGVTLASTAGAHTARLKHGGYWADLGICAANAILSVAVTLTQSVKIWVKAGSYTNSTARSVTQGAGSGFAFAFEGYNATRGDLMTNFAAVAGTSMPTFTGAGSFQLSGNDTVVRCIDFTQSVSGSVLTLSAARCRCEKVRATNTNAAAGAIALSMVGQGCEFLAGYLNCPTTATKTVSTATNGNGLIHGTVIAGGLVGLIATQYTTVMRCFFTGQASDSVQTASPSGAIQFINNTIYNLAGHGISIGQGGGGFIIANNYIEGNNVSGKYCITNTTGTNLVNIGLYGNAGFAMTAMYNGFAEPYQFADNGILAASALTNPGSGDFSIKSAYRGTAYPGQFENLSTTTGYLDVGAAEHQSAAGGAVYHPLKAFIVRGA
jgi:hypothetical protein